MGKEWYDPISMQRLFQRAEQELRDWDYEYQVQDKESDERKNVVGAGGARLFDNCCR